MRYGYSMALLGSMLFLSAVSATPVESGPPEPDCRETTTIFVVRHADRAGKADSLSAAGVRRAEALAHLGEHAGIGAIYHSDTRRARDTAAPLADRIGVRPVELPGADVEGLASQLLTRQCGKAVLVVGHSNTVGKILAALGGPDVPDLDEAEYDRLFVLSVRKGTPVTLVRLQYGEPSP